MSKSFLFQTKFIITEWEIKEIRKYELNFNEATILLYFINQKKPLLNIPEIKQVLGMNESLIMETFSSLLTKKIISLVMQKNEEGKLEEIINLDNFYHGIEEKYQQTDYNEKSSNIFSKFETEFGRPLSPMELEIINGWLNDNMNEELILCALKEAVYNGVSNMRYIDKILYEWRKKGYKSPTDISKGLNKKNEDAKAPLFDYDWLSDDK